MDIPTAKQYLTGPVMSIQTPFNSEGLIDYDGVANIIDVSLAGGSKTVMLTAGDSHYDCLGDDEIVELTRFVCRHSKGKGMIIVADRYHATSRAKRFAEYARKLGADMYMALPPEMGNCSCTPATFAKHYAAIAEIMPVMIVTNRFLRRSTAFGLETISRALDMSENIVAIKDDVCGDFAQDLCARFHDRVAIIAGGQKRHHMNMLPYGCDGYLSTFVTYNSGISHTYWAAIDRNDLAQARKIITDQDMPFFEYIISLQGGFDAGMHGMLELFGLAGRFRREPYYTLNDKEMNDLREFLVSKQILA